MDSHDDENEYIRQLTEQNRQQADQLQHQAARIRQLEAELERLKLLLAGKADSKTAKKPVFKENYSLGRNARRKRKRQTVPSTGRRPTEQKREIVTSEYDVSHADADLKQCVLRREQFVWRIIDGQAVYVGYRIYDSPDSKQLPLPPGLRNSRSEYGLEIILILAFLHYWIGVSLDHACEVMRFFTKLELSKSQADSLLKQLATDWNEQYDTIAELIALQMIVYIDETGWKVGVKSCYTWVFSTTMHVLFRCGVSRAKTEATAVLGDVFAGIGVTDDYAAYKSLFTQHQLCWAHLIRKAIKLALQYPDHPEYATFLDELCETYHQALVINATVGSASVAWRRPSNCSTASADSVHITANGLLRMRPRRIWRTSSACRTSCWTTRTACSCSSSIRRSRPPTIAVNEMLAAKPKSAKGPGPARQPTEPSDAA